jgi:tetratricopeptide (TPR) repeat protein
MGIDAYYQGDWSRALEYYERSRAVRQKAGDVIGVATQENNIGEILSDQGHFDAAARLFTRARDEWRAADYKVGVALATSNLGRLALRSGDPVEGNERLVDALGRFESIGSTVYVAETEARLAECLVLSGRTTEATEALRRLHQRIGALDGADLLMAAALRLSGIVRAQSGDVGAALALLDDSADRAQAVGGAFEWAQSLAARAMVAFEGPTRDDRVMARMRADARSAVALFVELGVADVPVTSLVDRWPAGPGHSRGPQSVQTSPGYNARDMSRRR